MLSIIGSPVTDRNPELVRNDRGCGEDNIAWLARQAEALSPKAEDKSGEPEGGAPRNQTEVDRARQISDPTFILLLGATDRVAFRLRLAQAHLRHDLWPSHWSHAALVAPTRDSSARSAGPLIEASTSVYEVSLQPSGGFSSTVTNNGMELLVRSTSEVTESVQADGGESTGVTDMKPSPILKPRATLEQYRDPIRYTNIALLRLNVPRSAWEQRRHTEIGPDRVRHPTFSVIESLSRQRGLIDMPEIMLVWLAFLWGAARTPNPLFEGHGIPSAIMVDAVLSAVGYDISPGIDSRLTCPETIWQAAKWWHLYYSGDHTMDTIAGRYDIATKINENLLTLPQTTNPSD